MYLIFDTETTGLPRDYRAPVTDLDNWPRLVQLGWQLHAADGKLLDQQCHIVRPEGFSIPFNAEKVHGITTELAQREGKPLGEVLDAFAAALAQTSLIVGHNIEFDLKIMGAEFLRDGRENLLDARASLDTKEEATEFVNIRIGKQQKIKWPTLTELYEKLFGEAFEDAHNAAFDVEATAKAFFGLLERGVVKPPEDAPEVEVWQYEAPDLSAEREEARRIAAERAAADQEAAGVREVDDAEVRPFVHLHVHSQYSVLQASAKVEELVERAAQDGMQAIAITDRGNLFGAFYAVEAGKKHGIKVIIGCEVYMTEDRHQKKFTRDFKDKRHAIPLLAKNQEGFRNLTQLVSRGYIEGYYGGYPRVDKELIAEHKDELIALTGGLEGEIPEMILNRGEEQAEQAFQWWLETFRDNLYVELQRHGGLEEEKRVNQVLLQWARKYHVPVIAANNVYYPQREDSPVHDVLLCVDQGETVDVPIGAGRGYRFGFPNDTFYLKSQQEMNGLFGDLPEALEQTVRIADQCAPLEVRREVLLPNFPLPEGFDSQDDYLRHLVYEGAASRYPELTEAIRERLDHELKIIADMGFPGYFLIVRDLIAQSRKLGVWVGPGRGSAAGSAVAYCIGITNIDPLRFNLLFERFLNPERVSMPDIDIDFDDEGRQKVIDYTVEAYGKEQVAHIITFGTMAARAVIRDVARVQGLPLSEADKMAKLVPELPVGIKLKDAISKVAELGEIEQEESERGQVLRMAKRLEGSVRNVGLHAAGIIIAPDKLLNYIPVCTSKDTDLYVTQYDGKIIEDAGMLKMDFLGLKNLSILKTAIRYVQERRGIEIDPDAIPEDDEKTFELYQKGQTIGTFQFESEGMRAHLRNLKPTQLEDLIAMNALYRPGPMDFIPNFIDRKHGREKVEYPHPWLEDILKPTYGIMVYQEQIMQTAQIIGGFSLGKADILRRAMGKKKMDVMQSMKEEFIAGAQEKDIDKNKAEEIFGVMEKFAQYGFNRSHSAAYSVLAYQTGYMKANYPAEYMAALLAHNMSDLKKVQLFIEDCRKLGVEVLGPHVNESRYHFRVNEHEQIRFGLGAIKGVGEGAVDAIVAERQEGGPYTSVFDLARRVDLKAVTKKALEALAACGALDGLGDAHRGQYLGHYETENITGVERAHRFGVKYKEQKQSAQQSLFGDLGDEYIPEPELPKTPPLAIMDQLTREKELLGFYVSGHPLDDFRHEIQLFTTCSLKDLARFREREVKVAGVVGSVKQSRDKRGAPMARFTLEDYEGSVQLMLFSENFMRWKNYLEPGERLVVDGKVRGRFNSEEDVEIMISQMSLLSTLKDAAPRPFTVRIPVLMIDAEVTDRLRELVQAHPGKYPLQVELVDTAQQIVLKMQSEDLRVDPDNKLLQALEDITGVYIKLG